MAVPAGLVSPRRLISEDLSREQKAVTVKDSQVAAPTTAMAGGVLSDAGNQAFAFEYLSDLFKACTDISSRKANLAKSSYIRELRAALFQEDDSALEAKTSLKQASFVHDILARVLASIGMVVFGSADQEGHRRIIEHHGEAFSGSNASSGHTVKLFEVEP